MQGSQTQQEIKTELTRLKKNSKFRELDFYQLQSTHTGNSSDVKSRYSAKTIHQWLQLAHKQVASC